MPSKSRKSSQSTTARNKVEKVMHEFKAGALRSSSGARVKSRKQAVAIGLSEARAAGAKLPRKAKDGASRTH